MVMLVRPRRRAGLRLSLALAAALLLLCLATVGRWESAAWIGRQVGGGGGERHTCPAHCRCSRRRLDVSRSRIPLACT